MRRTLLSLNLLALAFSCYAITHAQVGAGGSIATGSGTAGGGGGASSASWTIVKKTADTSRNNNAGSGANVVVADPDLTFTMQASKTYAIKGVIFMTVDNASVGNLIAHQFQCPASPTVVIGALRRQADALSYSERVFDACDTSNQNMGVQGTAATAQNGVGWLDILIQNGANAGSFTFAWVSVSSSANSATVRKGSYLAYQIQ